MCAVFSSWLSCFGPPLTASLECMCFFCSLLWTGRLCGPQALLSGEVSSIDMRAGKQAGGGQYIMTMKVVAKEDSARAMVRLHAALPLFC